MENRCYFPSEIDFSRNDLENRVEPRQVLLCSPDHFDVVDQKNVHMQVGQTDHQRAMEQWVALKAVYEQVEDQGALHGVHVLPGVPGMEDLVFCANQTLPWQTEEGHRTVVLSKMRHESRKREVPHLQAFFESRGYSSKSLPDHIRLFEGMGDTIPHPGKKLLYGGYGHRSDPEAHEAVSTLLEVPVVALELIDPRFYHLDTCFLPVTETTVMLCTAAFSDESLNALGQLFDRIIPIPESEAVGAFALNAHLIPHDEHPAAIIQQNATQTIGILKEMGFTVYPVDTSEFMQSGGSVFCMKMMFY